MSGLIVFDNPINVRERRSSTSAQNFKEDVFKSIITREEVENLARDSISSDFELIDYELKAYSDEKVGFLASHRSLMVIGRRPEYDEYIRKSFFVKVMPIDQPSQVAYIEEKGAFRKEVGFFKFIEPLLAKNYRGISWVPRCYLIKDNVLVFENMNHKGFSNKPKIFDKKTVKSAVTCIARFHAASLLAEEQFNGQSLNKIYPEVFEEAEYKRKGHSYTWFVTAINLAISVAKDLGLDTSNALTASERVFDMAQPSNNKRNVVSHGDLWSSNLMFDDTDHCNLVDFQLIRYAPLAHDLMQLLYLTSTREFRERHERDMIDHYYVELKENLAFNNFKGVVPPFEEIIQGVEEQRYPALVTTMINYPTIMMDGKIGAKIMSGVDAYEAYFLRDRRPFVNKIMAFDPEYERKIKTLTREFIEMSLKIDTLPRPT